MKSKFQFTFIDPHYRNLNNENERHNLFDFFDLICSYQNYTKTQDQIISSLVFSLIDYDVMLLLKTKQRDKKIEDDLKQIINIDHCC
jgi:hypothetical protein